MRTELVPIEQSFTTTSAEETIEVGRQLAHILKPPAFVILRGDLGAGKTTLLKGIAEALGAADAEEVTSPTFTLVHVYEGTSPVTKAKLQLYHLDLYRLDEERQLATLGIEEMISDDSLVFVEWGEKFASLVAQADGEICLSSPDETTRFIILRLCA